MPLPRPNNKEKYSDFMDRCMIDLSKKKEFKDSKQRAAVCYSQFGKAESDASVVINNPWDESDKILFFHKSFFFDEEKESSKDGED
jgi:hypothetical protein|tara:strand:- start:5823 stop:6080 length:258 start_codon:yes stop_codon:yes gene_type:complete